ncbi:hypothetical protein HY989_05250 [Candidatus Micrarchaeota archaeon]|nr:hypothetical protein [Candidatus Micrarchaeota archaeon]
MKPDKMSLILLAISVLFLFNVLLDFNPNVRYSPMLDDFLALGTLEIFKGNLMSGANPFENNQWFCSNYSPMSDGLSQLWFFPSPLIYTLFGHDFYVKLTYLLAMAFSGIFFWWFSKELTDSDSARLFGSLMYMLGGVVVGLIYWGPWEHIITYPMIPLALMYGLRALHKETNMAVLKSAAIFSVMIYIGTPYFVGYIFMMLTFALIFPFEGERKWSRAITLGKILAVALLLSAPRLLTMQYPDIRVADVNGLDFGEILNHFLNRRQAWYQVRARELYMGILPIMLAIFGLLSDSKKKGLLAFSLLWFVLWAEGTNNIMNFFPLKIPLANMLRDYRFAMWVFPLLISALAVLGLKEIEPKLKPKSLLLAFFGFFIFLEGLTSIFQPTGISSFINYQHLFYFIPNTADALANLLPMVGVLALTYLAARETKASLPMTILILLAVFHIITITLPILRPYPDFAADPDVKAVSQSLGKDTWVYVNADEFGSRLVYGLTFNGVKVVNPPFQPSFKVTDTNMGCGKFVVAMRELPDTIALATNLPAPNTYAAKISKYSQYGKVLVYKIDQMGIAPLPQQPVVWDLKYGSFLYEKS